MRATIYGRDTLIIGFHADNTPTYDTINGKRTIVKTADVVLRESVERLDSVLSTLPSVKVVQDTILLSDFNHEQNTLQDYLSYTDPGAPRAQRHPTGARAFASLLHTYSLADTFRTRYPLKREYTRLASWKQAGVTTPLSKARLDGCFVSTHLLTNSAPAVHDVRHIQPSADQLESLRQLQEAGTTKTVSWSDHSAVHLDIRYSDLNGAPTQWRFPNFLLNDRDTYDEILKRITEATEGSGPCAPRLMNLLDDIKAYVIDKTKRAKKKFRLRVTHLRKCIRRSEEALGLTYTDAPPASYATLAPHLRQAAKTKESRILDSLRLQLATTLSHRQQFFETELTADEINGEACSKDFFRPTSRKPKYRSPITQLRDSTGTIKRAQPDLNTVADKFYSAPGGVYNLPDERDPLCEQRLLNALIRDNRTLPDDSRNRLSVSRIIHALLYDVV